MRLISISLIILLLQSCSTVDIKNEINTGIRQYENDSLNEAVITLTKVISVTDTCTNCFLYRGFAYKDLVQYDKALQDFNSFINIDTNAAVGYANRASVYYLKNDYQAALKDFTKAYQINPTSKHLLNPISHMLFATGQKDEACNYYKRALEMGDTTFDNSIKTYCGKKGQH